MSAVEQYVLVGVARARERWASDLARWSTSGAAPLEFVKCLTPDEARAVLGSGRRASALLLDARGPGVDRDLIAAAAAVNVPTIVVSDGSVHRDWDALGCAVVIDQELELSELMEVLDRETVPVDRSRRPGRTILSPDHRPRTGRVIAVVGIGGAGASTVAMAAAQDLATDAGRAVPSEGSVAPEGGLVLVDGARRGSLAMYHHIGDVVPGLPELVEAHRSDRLDPEAVRELTFDVPRRGYHLLLGRRRTADWVTARRGAVDAAIDGLTRAYATVVVDLDPDVDDQAATGSPDVEDRHAVTLASLEIADLVLVVGRGDLHGVQALVGLLDELLDAGVPAPRILPVINGAPRSPAARSAITAAVARLAEGVDADTAVRPVLHLRRVRNLEDVHDRVAPLPRSLTRPVGHQVRHLLSSPAGRPSDTTARRRVRAGELGTAVLALGAHDDEPRSDVA